MNIIIIGGGKVGVSLCGKLKLKLEGEITIIEKDEERCKEIADALDATVINGDGVDMEILRDIGNVDVVIATTRSDEVNLVSCLLAKSLGVKKVIALVNELKFEHIFENLGVSDAICISDTLASSILNSIR